MDFVEEEASSIEGIYRIGNYWFIAHSNDGSINRTANSTSYTHTSAYQSQRFIFGDPSITKKLVGVVVTSAPQPSAGQVVVKYRKDEETAWTTIFTSTTDNAIFHGSLTDANGKTLPQFREIQFRIESTGGTEITSLKFKADTLTKEII